MFFNSYQPFFFWLRFLKLFLTELAIYPVSMPALFRKCPACGKKMAASDPHAVCISCLPSSHKVESCYHCKSFSSRTLRDRERIRLQAVSERLKARMESYQEGQYRHSDSPSKKRQLPECSPSLSAPSRKRPSSSTSTPASKKHRSTSPTSRHHKSPSSRHASTSRTTSGSRYGGEESRAASKHPSTLSVPQTSKSMTSKPGTTARHPPSSHRRSTSRSRQSPRRRSCSPSRAAKRPTSADTRRSPSRTPRRSASTAPRRSTSTTRRSTSRSPSRGLTSRAEKSRSPATKPSVQRRSSTSRDHDSSTSMVTPIAEVDTVPVASSSAASSPGLNIVQISPEVSPVVGEEQRRKRPRVLSSPDSDYSQTYSPSRIATTPRRSPSRSKRRSRSKSRSSHRRDKSKDRSRSTHSSPKRRRRISPSFSSPQRSSLRDYSPTLSATPPSRVSPIDDLSTFNEVLCRGANKFNITMSTPTVSSSIIFETLHHRSASKPLLPLVPGIIELTNRTFLTPASVGSVPSRIAKKYKAPDVDPLFLRTDPPPDSIIVAAARKANPSMTSSSVPPEKDSKIMDSLGRRMCNTSASALKIASASALLGRYDRSLWDSLSRFTERLPKEDQEDFKEILQEGGLVANQTISAAADAADLSAHGYSHGVCSRRAAWLRLTGLKPEVQCKITNLPFNGSSLFGPHADEEMTKMKTELDTVKAVGLEKRKDFRRRFRSFDRRQSQQKGQTSQWSSQGHQQQPRSQFQQRRPGRGRGNNRQQSSAAKPPQKQ